MGAETQTQYKAKWFCVAVAGDTTDGREISEEWIVQMAQSYNPKVFGARINVEHIRSYAPDSIFGAYGDVLALKTEKIDMNGVQKLALFALLQPNENLIALNKRNQKIYTSVEVNPNFAKTGTAYLVGLAVTDSPASLGTEMLQFAAGASVNPLASRKQDKDNVFSVAHEVDMQFEEVSESILDKVRNLFSKQDKTNQQVESKIGDSEKVIVELANYISETQTDLQQVKADYAALSQQLTELQQRLQQQPAVPPRREMSTAQSYNVDADNIVDC